MVFLVISQGVPFKTHPPDGDAPRTHQVDHLQREKPPASPIILAAISL